MSMVQLKSNYQADALISASCSLGVKVVIKFRTIDISQSSVWLGAY